MSVSNSYNNLQSTGSTLDSVDAFDLSNKFNILLLFDCPTKDNTSYQSFSTGILSNLNQVLVVFLDTEIPQQIMRQLHQLQRQSSLTSNSNNNQSHPGSQHGSHTNLAQLERNNSFSHHQHLIPQNVISTYDNALVWLLIGIFCSHSNKQVQIFTDQIDLFKSKLQTSTYERRLKSNICIQPCSNVTNFSLEETLNPWLQFDNNEVLSSFEVEQLKIILKKFIKQVVSSKHPHNLEKLINITQNLVKAHLSSLQKDKYKVHTDLTYHFIRSLFLENILKNEVIFSAIMTNQVRCLEDLEQFTNINYTDKFQSIIDKIQASIEEKKLEAQKALNEQIASEAEKLNKQNEGMKRKMTNEEEESTEQISEEKVVYQAVLTLIDQYLHLFQKGKIFEIKKILKLVKQIQNYVVGFIKKMETDQNNRKSRSQVSILEKSTKLISINILKLIAQHGLIKQQQDTNQIEHDAQRVQELLIHQFFQKHLKETDLIYNYELANQIYDQPSLVFKKEENNANLVVRS